MAVKDIFCFLSICNLHTMGIGRSRTITSVSRLEMPLARENGIRLKHLGSAIVLSQKAATGTHSNMPAKKSPTHHMSTIAPTAYMAHR